MQQPHSRDVGNWGAAWRRTSGPLALMLHLLLLLTGAGEALTRPTLPRM